MPDIRKMLALGVAVAGLSGAVVPSVRAADTGKPVAAAGVTLKSVSVTLPSSNREFPGGASADAVNRNCTACHSPGMILTQPAMSQAGWQAEVNKMRDTYKAPLVPDDIPAIVSYLVAQKGTK